MGEQDVTSMPVITSGSHRVELVIWVRLILWISKGSGPTRVSAKSSAIQAVTWPLLHGI